MCVRRETSVQLTSRPSQVASAIGGRFTFHRVSIGLLLGEHGHASVLALSLCIYVAVQGSRASVIERNVSSSAPEMREGVICKRCCKALDVREKSPVELFTSSALSTAWLPWCLILAV